MRKRPTDKIKDDVIKAYIDGKTAYEVADLFGIFRSTVIKLLKRNDIKIRKSEDYTRKKFDFNYFNEIDTPEKSYWLGFIYADGNICGNTFTITQSKPEILKQFIKSIGANEETLYKYNKNGPTKNKVCYRFSTHNKQLCNNLIKHGIYPKKSNRNDGFLLSCNEFKSSFIRGVFDGDGSIVCSKNPKYSRDIHFDITCASERMITDIQSILMFECLLKQTKIKFKLSKKTKKKTYSLSYSGNRQCKKIFSFLYKNPYPRLERKYIKFIEFFEKPKKVKNSYVFPWSVDGVEHLA